MVKSNKVMMPHTSAGILGFSSNTKLAGIEISAKTVVLFTVLFIVLVKLATYLVHA